MDENTNGIAVEDVQEGQGITVTAEGKFTTQIPNLSDAEAVDEWEAMLSEHISSKGVGTLLKNLHKYKQHERLVATFGKKLHKGVAWINGVRVGNQKAGGRTKSLKATAQHFYESLNTPALRLQCTLFNIDYDQYESQEDIIALLVDKHVAMMNGASISGK